MYPKLLFVEKKKRKKDLSDGPKLKVLSCFKEEAF